MTLADSWNPAQYNKFRDQRMEPFFDLVAFIQQQTGMRAIDLGCGTGELTKMLADRLEGSTVEGVDSSNSMLASSKAYAGDRVSFREADIGELSDFSAYDLVFSNAALQWVPDNEELMARLLETLKPGGQVAVQVPKNELHPSHQLADELALERPFREQLGGFVRHSEALSLERYSELLYQYGLREQRCIEKIYGHELAHSEDVIEWVKSTSLNAYLSRLDAPFKEGFLAEYRERLLAEIGDRSPYFYPFRRLLFWGRKAA